jgi:hypothetical protein
MKTYFFCRIFVIFVVVVVVIAVGRRVRWSTRSECEGLFLSIHFV